MRLDLLRNYISLSKWPFSASFHQNFSTICTHMISKFWRKSAQKWPIFISQANYARGLLLFLLLFLSCSLYANEIGGFWKAVDEKTGRPRCLVAVYNYQGKYFGRIVALYNDRGQRVDTIYEPDERAPGIAGNPYYCGMDIIWGLEWHKKNFSGKIVDPEKGNIYNCELWTNNGLLIVRGKLLCFGKNQAWVPAHDADFSYGFAKPDVNMFVPQFPRPNK